MGYLRFNKPPLCKVLSQAMASFVNKTSPWHFRKKMTEGLLKKLNFMQKTIPQSLRDSSLYTREPSLLTKYIFQNKDSKMYNRCTFMSLPPRGRGTT